MANIKTPKKLIEVALPLDDVNAAASREKSIRHGHPSTLHLWWARRPLAAARAILFAQLVNDPGYERHLQRGINKDAAKKERQRLLDIMRRLVEWENTNNEEVLREAREEIMRSWRETCELNKGIPGFDPEHLPAFHDPFAGGGAIPLEAQRLGLEAYASDLNPVAVMINKAMIEIPPKFKDLAPVNPESRDGFLPREWPKSSGLADDVRYYGKWMRDEAYKRIGHLFPEIDLPSEHGHGKATIIAWLWVRTVQSPNPAFNHVDVPLASTFFLSTKAGKEVYVEPIVDGDKYSFQVKYEKPDNYDQVASGTGYLKENGKRLKATFRCLLSGTPIKAEYIDEEAAKGALGIKLMAIVAESTGGRIYLSPNCVDQDRIDSELQNYLQNEQFVSGLPLQSCRGTFASNAQGRRYGFNEFRDYFTPRQLVALSTFSDLVLEARNKVVQDAIDAAREHVTTSLNDGGTGAYAYADAIAVYLAFAVDKSANLWSSLCSWMSDRGAFRETFARQAIPMVWDFAEANPFSNSGGNFYTAIEKSQKAIEYTPSYGIGHAAQFDAGTQELSKGKIVSTDPPYYGNIDYAELADFFYVWLRRSLRTVFPDVFATLLTPKVEQLVATPFRHKNREAAEEFFITGMTKVLRNLADTTHSAFPITIYYAFKQTETSEGGTSSTGWVTFLEALLRAGLEITGTWPVKTEGSGRIVARESNALASSIVLVCRKRVVDAETISRRMFIRELNEVLPESLDIMIGGSEDMGPIAAVDLQQAAIGPGMAVFSRYSAVLEADGTPMSVRTALQLINRFVDAYLNSAEGELDADTLFCLNWFEQFGWETGKYGQAEVLATAKGTTVDGMRDSGVLTASQGEVRLLRWREYPDGWNPQQDNRTPVWEALHQLIRAMQERGEQCAGTLLAGMPGLQEPIRTLAYRLYTVCERKGRAEDARSYNELIASWDALDGFVQKAGPYGKQSELF